MEFRTPSPVVDIIIETPAGVVLIERANAPHGFALPGGFVDEGETIESAAIREAKEETGLDVTLTDLLYVYSDPSRDPRQHTISSVFIATASGTPRGQDDAKEAFAIPVEGLFDRDYVFDHRRILDDYVRFRKTGQRPSPSEFL